MTIGKQCVKHTECPDGTFPDLPSALVFLRFRPRSNAEEPHAARSCLQEMPKPLCSDLLER